MGAFKPAADLLDNLHTSEEERLEAKARLLNAQGAALKQALRFEGEVMAARARIVEAEAKSDHWLAANWRPMTMIGFVAMAFGDAVGLLTLSENAWHLLHLGLGGYVGGRSVEKISRIFRYGRS